MESLHSSETSVLIRATRRHIPEDGIVRRHRRENLKSDGLFSVHDMCVRQYCITPKVLSQLPGACLPQG
jgi:hypothetical protein